MAAVYLALDLATSSGVCWGEPNTYPEFETWRLGGTNVPRGRRGMVLIERMVAVLKYVKPTKVFIEQPLPAHASNKVGTTIDTTIALNGYCMIAEAICHSRDTPTRLFERQDIMKHFVGVGRFHKNAGANAAKKAVMTRCTMLRWMPANYDEADAGALWHYGCALENPRAYALAGVNEAVQLHRKRR